jgi:multiple sugar transport system substrate-binding protein
MLTDAYGLYYNLDMFKAAGIAAPPKTFSELMADAQKLTQLNPDGSIKVAGFVPLNTFYEVPNMENGAYSGSHWYDAAGKSTLASDPTWEHLLNYMKTFIDWYGYDKLQKFFNSVGGSGSEFSSSNAFETGKVAMNFDGEWRVSFIKGDNSTVNYATAPGPVADDQAARYGAGQIGGTIIGIPRGAAHASAAWQLVKYLALDTQAEVTLSNALSNVPTTLAAGKDPALNQDPHFATFVQVFANPNSSYKEITPLGTADVNILSDVINRYEAGQVADLHAALQKAATQIDQQNQLGG